jgi:ATP-dependent Clp protease protease subunit
MKWFDNTGNLFAKGAGVIESKLLKDRIVFLGTPIDEAIANHVIAQLLFLEDADSKQDINLYVNSPGGSISASMAIYDVINSIKPDMTTICVGQASGTAALLVAGGTKGKRFALPLAYFKFVRFEFGDGALKAKNSSEIERYKRELEHAENIIFKAFSKATGQTEQQIRHDHDGHLFLRAGDAIKYGLIDRIVEANNKAEK